MQLYIILQVRNESLELSLLPENNKKKSDLGCKWPYREP